MIFRPDILLYSALISLIFSFLIAALWIKSFTKAAWRQGGFRRR
jgi:hypothetical protein